VAGRTANEVKAELDRIRGNGSFSGQAVVDASRPEDAILHRAFEWNDTIAGEKFRLVQARTLTRVVIRLPEKSGEQEVPAFVSVAQNIYVPVEAVVNQIDLFEVALQRLHVQVQHAERAVRELEQAARQGGDPDRLAQIALAVAAFDTVREALAVLK